MSDFFRFPHTPHIAWLGEGGPRDDKLLSAAEGAELLSGDVVVEEKLDGANVGISFDANGKLRAQNRGSYLEEPFSGQFVRLNAWLAQRRFTLEDHLPKHLMLFGEWCAARHSLDYDSLPDWFLLFDVYDRSAQKFWSTARRDALAETLQLKVVPRMFSGTVTLADLRKLLESSPSHYREGPLEGIVIRKEDPLWCEARAKLVRADFAQTISEHWRSRVMEWNKVKI